VDYHDYLILFIWGIQTTVIILPELIFWGIGTAMITLVYTFGGLEVPVTNRDFD
jgi:hypothetical protein